MNPLNQIESGRAIRPRRILLYGPRGMGLSTVAAALPSPVFVTVDDSVAHLDVPRFSIAVRFSGVMAALQELYVQPHDYRVVVIDPLDALEQLVLDALCRERGIERADDLLFAKGYTLALSVWRQLLERLDHLRRDIGLHCVLVARAQGERHSQPVSGGVIVIERQVPALDRQASALVQNWCDAVLFATYAETNCSTVCAPTAGERVLHTQPVSAYAAKNRLGLPAQLPMQASALVPFLPELPSPPLSGESSAAPQAIRVPSRRGRK